MAYSFLVLSLLFLLPGAITFLLRPDLRRVMALMALCSLPFAFTERLFYPTYWEPRFLFDLADRIGFGIEDLLFVVGLAAFTSTAYAFFCGARLEPVAAPTRARDVARRVGLLLAVTFLLVGVAALARVPMIYGSFAIMLAVSAAVCLARRDLWLPALAGGVLSMLVYGLLCLLLGGMLPGVFLLAWHTERFLGVFLLGVPVEELMYGFAAGVAATSFYPYVSHQRYRTGGKACDGRR